MLKKTFPAFLLLLLTTAGTASQVSANRLTGTINLGSDTYRGVTATAQLTFPEPETEPAGVLKALLSVRFVSEKSGAPQTEGDVAVKVGSEEGRMGAPLRLNPIDGWFRAEVNIDRRGETLLKVGSKLNDGKKRIYRFFTSP